MGFGHSQPGGWAYSVLPFIEQQALFEMGSGLDSRLWPVSYTKKIFLRKALQTPVGLFYCPSRRAPKAYPVQEKYNSINWHHNWTPQNLGPLNRSDYAGCVGSVSIVWGTHVLMPKNGYLDHETFHLWPPEGHFDGVIFMRSEVPMAYILDGTSNTYMVGEKNVRVQAYTGWNGIQPNHSGNPSVDYGDAEGCWSGGDANRSSGSLPFPDDPAAHLYENWGSAHPAVFHMMFADGSVRPVSYSIDADLHLALGSRDGGEVVERKDL